MKERDVDIDQWFKDRKLQRSLQGQVLPRPSFSAKELLKLTNKDLIRYNRLVSAEKIKPGTRTNISSIEIILPWLYSKYGLVENLKEKNNIGNTEKASIVGTKLHNADVLFSLVLQGIRGSEISKYLPTTSKKEVEYFIKATDSIAADKFGGKDDLQERLNLAWENYHGNKDTFAEMPQSALPGFGAPDFLERKEIFFSDEVKEIGLKLAKAWADEYCCVDPITWEFHPDVFSQREIMVSLSFQDSKLTFNGRIDGVTRLLRDKKKKAVQAQIIDLKTGKYSEKDGIAQEVLLRQQQVMYIMAERFTGRYLKGFNSVSPPKGIFQMAVRGGGKVYSERLNKAGYRWFDKESGEMTLKEFTMSEPERNEFFDWMIVYGNLINLNKEEVRKLVKRRPVWDLDQ